MKGIRPGPVVRGRRSPAGAPRGRHGGGGIARRVRYEEMWGVRDLPIFMVERRFASELEASAEQADEINLINDEEGVRWLYSFLSADKRKTYCLYEAPFADSIRRAAERAGLPADSVVEVSGLVLPDGSQARVPDEVRAD
jgi:hypothetical protein